MSFYGLDTQGVVTRTDFLTGPTAVPIPAATVNANVIPYAYQLIHGGGRPNVNPNTAYGLSGMMLDSDGVSPDYFAIYGGFYGTNWWYVSRAMQSDVVYATNNGSVYPTRVSPNYGGTFPIGAIKSTNFIGAFIGNADQLTNSVVNLTNSPVAFLPNWVNVYLWGTNMLCSITNVPGIVVAVGTASTTASGALTNGGNNFTVFGVGQVTSLQIGSVNTTTNGYSYRYP